jgi:putative ubiquitin-RnfH superfamily antitoxin RatB of RatAB toxin-antitoxin module
MNSPRLEVTVAFSPAAGELDLVRLSLPAGSTVADALAASGVLERHPGAAGLPVGIWGSRQEPDTRLRAQDRVEIYRPLLCDPKEARRLRYREKSERIKAAGAAAREAKVSGNPSR